MKKAIGKLLVHRARIFATKAHGAIGQKRMYTDEPYINHPAAVVGIVERYGHTPEMLAAAWLHDVVEDTPVTLDEIHLRFGPEVARLVNWLTDIDKPEDGNRAKRMALNRARWSRAPSDAQTIKVADLIHNTESICEHDPKFAKVYLPEKAALLEVLTKANPRIVAFARDQLERKRHAL